MSVFTYFGPGIDTGNVHTKSYRCFECERLKKNQIDYRANVGVATSNLAKHLRIGHPEFFKQYQLDQVLI